LSSNFCIFRNTTCNVSQWSNATENCLQQARFHLLQKIGLNLHWYINGFWPHNKSISQCKI
jgi:hypothetical protein